MSASSLQTIIKVGHVSFSARPLIPLTYPVLPGQFMDKIKTFIKKKKIVIDRTSFHKSSRPVMYHLAYVYRPNKHNPYLIHIMSSQNWTNSFINEKVYKQHSFP